MPDPGAEVVLAIRGLSAWVGTGDAGRPVLDGIDLEVRQGETVALLGESGSGKSTLGLAILGLLSPVTAWRLTGAAEVAGTAVVGATPDVLRALRHRQVGMVFQDPIGALNPTMRIGRQIEEAIVDDTTAEQWLERVGIAEPATKLRAYPHQLSGGQCQRVMIAMALARRPKLVIADEPTTALDVVVQAQVLELLGRLTREDGVALLLVTHDLAVATTVADRLAVMLTGRLVETGAAAALIERPAHPYTAALLRSRFGMRVDRDRMLPTMRADEGAMAGARAGCGFASRCSLVIDACRVAAPLPMRAAHGGETACIRPADVAVADGGGRAWPMPPPPLGNLLLELAVVDREYVLAPERPFGPRHVFSALSGINLRIYAGEAVALVGASGSGKSTLLKIAAGLDMPDRGDVVLDGGERPQVVFQDAAGSLTPWLTIGEQIAERLRPERLGAAAIRERVAAALADVGLDPAFASARPGRLSGGQCQRASLARAIIVPPRLLLCDEAVSAMDVSLAASILNLIGVLRRRLGMALLFVTHDLAAARFVADRIVVMAQGRIVEQGPGDEVLERPAHAETRRLLAANPTLPTRAAA